MRIGTRVAGVTVKGIDFIRKQPRDWRVTAARMSLKTFAYRIVFPYQSIYIIALGATATQLGIVNSVGMAIAGLASPFTGWLIDRIGNKTVYLIGIGLLAISYLIYGVAQSWTIIIMAMGIYWLGDTTSIHSCATVCANSLANKDRATAMSFCETIAVGLMSMAGPIVGVSLVTSFGGINVEGIRPLFFVSLLVTGATFFFILTQLSNRRFRDQNKKSLNLFVGMSQVLSQRQNLKRWLIITSVGYLPMGMILPFFQVFAYEVKGADQYTLALMVTGSAIMSLVLGVPLGRLADKIGRKKVLYLVAPFFWASSLILIWAPNSKFLIAAGALQGFLYVYLTITAAMTAELAPSEQMGRWLGIIRLLRMLLTASVAYLAGIIWEHIGPEYVFLIAIGLDLFIRIPLLIGMPETLGLKDIGETRRLVKLD
jgi:MFS family permease